MADEKYFSIMTFMVINLLGVIYLTGGLPPQVFVKELAMIIILLIMGSIILFGISRRLNYSYAASSMLFGIALTNLVYLYLQIDQIDTSFGSQVTLLMLTALNIFGFLFSLERIGLFRKKSVMREYHDIEGQLRALKDKSEIIAKELKSLEDSSPKVIIENLEKSSPKKKAAKKKTTKKKPAKKSAKKSTKKKATKKSARKSSKK